MCNPVVVFNPAATMFNCYLSNPNEDLFIDDRIDTTEGTQVPEFNLESGGILHYELCGHYEGVPHTDGKYSDHGDLIFSGVARPDFNICKGYCSYESLTDTSTHISYNDYLVEWCKYKWVIFDTDVIIDTDGNKYLNDEQIHRAGVPIALNKYVTDYKVYFPSESSDGNNVRVTFWEETINDPHLRYPDNFEYSTNEDETADYGRYYGAPGDCASYAKYNVVGVIGNLTITDSGDFRYSNFFKQPTSDNKWIVEDVVHEVDVSKQNYYVIDRYDIFNKDPINLPNKWDTYGSQGHKKTDRYKILPLRPSYNNIKAYQNTAVRIGYDVLLDVETIGNYYNDDARLQVDYSYYGIDSSGKAIPLDVYMKKDGKYVLINDFYNEEEVYNDFTILNWDATHDRRMYTAIESSRTDAVAAAFGYETPGGDYLIQGNRNTLVLDGRSRTYIGGLYYSNSEFAEAFRDNDYMNKGETASNEEFYRGSQKWYFTCGLPSSAVFVEEGQAPTEANISKSSTYDKIIATAYIQAFGDTWGLMHDGTQSWSDANLKPPNSSDYPKVPDVPDPDIDPDNPDVPPDDPGPIPKTPPTPPTIIVEIEPPPASSADDVNAEGTH